MSRRTNWTDEEEVVLTHFFKSGLSDEELSKLLGRDTNAIRAKRQKLGLRIHPRKIKVDIPMKEITTPISPPKHADNLPDVGVQMKHLLDDHHIEQAILQDILVQLRDMNSLFRRLEKVTPNESTKPEKS